MDSVLVLHGQNEKGKTRGKNTAYIFEIDGVTICHLGDLGHVLTPDQVEEIEDIDILMIPVGGISALDAPLAAEVVRQLDPKVVIPMHYKTEALNRELEPVSRFLKEMGLQELEPQSKVSFTKAHLPVTTQVYLLNY